MDTKDWAIIGSAGLIVLLIGVVIMQNQASGGGEKQFVTGSAVASTSYRGDKFDGKITNAKVTTGEYEGKGVYDRSCQSIGGGLTNCHAGIDTTEFGVIDFNYEHNMAVKPCIAPGDKVLVTVLDASGKATVQRVY